MYQEFYRGHAMLALPVFALLFFIALFSIATVVTWRRGRKPDQLRALSLIPFDEETIPQGEHDV